MSVQIASAQGLNPKTDETRCSMLGYDRKEMAGYSGTPLAQKLGIKAGQKIACSFAQRGFVCDEGRSGRDVHSSLCFRAQNTGDRAEANPKTDRGHWNSLGLVA